jgi:hypothetical protein
MTMRKISSQDAKALLKTAGAAIRAVTEENAALREKVASYERHVRVEKIARDMEDKGLNTDLDFNQKVAALAHAQNLDVTEEAIKMAAPQGRVFGDVGEVPGQGVSSFETYIMTGEDPA